MLGSDFTQLQKSCIQASVFEVLRFKTPRLTRTTTAHFPCICICYTKQIHTNSLVQNCTLKNWRHFSAFCFRLKFQVHSPTNYWFMQLFSKVFETFENICICLEICNQILMVTSARWRKRTRLWNGWTCSHSKRSDGSRAVRASTKQKEIYMVNSRLSIQ